MPAVRVLGHAVEAGHKLAAPPSRFHLVHFSGELLLDALAQPDMPRTHDEAKEFYALAHGEHPLVWLDGKPIEFICPWTASRIFHNSAFVSPSTTPSSQYR